MATLPTWRRGRPTPPARRPVGTLESHGLSLHRDRRVRAPWFGARLEATGAIELQDCRISVAVLALAADLLETMPARGEVVEHGRRKAILDLHAGGQPGRIG